MTLDVDKIISGISAVCTIISRDLQNWSAIGTQLFNGFFRSPFIYSGRNKKPSIQEAHRRF